VAESESYSLAAPSAPKGEKMITINGYWLKLLTVSANRLGS
jgi:hypothetical protein